MTVAGIDRALEKKGVAPGVLLLLSIAAYLPAVHGYYLHTDDYFWSHWGGFPCDSVLWFMTIIGRPLAGVLFCLGSGITGIGTLNAVRFGSVVNTGFLGWLIFKWLRLWRVSPLLSLAVSVMVITLPAFQTYVAYVCTSVFGLGVTLAMAALFPAYHATKSRTPAGPAILSATLLILSLCLYQPATLFFISMLAAPLVLSDARSFIKDWRKPLLIYGAILLSALLVYYFFWRLWYVAYDVPSGGKYDGRNMATNYGSRLGWFVIHPLYEAVNFWAVRPGAFIVLVVALLVCGGILAEFLKTHPPGLDFAAKYAVVLLLVPASYAINFVSGDPATNYRTFCALSPVLLVITVFAAWHLLPVKAPQARKDLFAAAFSVLAIAGLWQAHHDVYAYFVRPDSAEFTHLKAVIADYVQAKGIPESIHVILPLPDVGRATQRNEFGEITLRHPPNIRPAVAAAVHELGIDRDIPVTLSEPGNPDLWFEFETRFRGNDLLPFRVPANPSGNVLSIDRSAFPDA